MGANLLESEARSAACQAAGLAGDPQAAALADNWESSAGKFWKVVPFPPTSEFPRSVYRFDPADIALAAAV